MAYTAPSGLALRNKKGTLTDKIAAELSSIDSELDTITLGSIALNSGEMLVGNAANAAAAVTPSGDVTISNTGVTTIGAKKVTESMIALADAKILVGGAGGAAAAQTMSGDATLANTGALTIGSKKIGKAHLVSESEAVAGQIFVTTGAAYAVDEVAVSGDATLAANGALTIADSVLEGSNVANTANDNVIGGIPVIHAVAIEHATANNDVTLTHKTRVVDFWFIPSGLPSTSDKVQLLNGVNAITDDIACVATTGRVVRATTIDDTYSTIAAGGTLRVAATADTAVAGVAYVLGVRSA